MPPSLLSRMLRTKDIPRGDLETPLNRCLSTFDLTLFGVSHMVGSGIYVVTGAVLKNTAGPSIIISFMLAGFAALLCALCYAELSARYPKAGSAYTYTYVGCGEVWAFIIGWNVVLEHLVGAAVLSRAWSNNLDTMLNGAISNTTMSILGQMGDGRMIARYPDVVAVVFAVVCSACVALGSKTSSRFINMFSMANLLVISFVVVVGAFYMDFSNWTGLDHHGNSRFFPYGIDGTLAGAATCFFSYIGFEGIGTAGEEAKDPAKSLPRATVFSMLIATAAYVLMSGVISLMVPYEMVHPSSAFPLAFEMNGAGWAKYAVAIGALFAITTCALGYLYSLPRCAYSIASDGLLFEFLGRVNKKTQTPINAGAFFTIIVCAMALTFEQDALVEFISIGTLLAYTIVSASVIILRYRPGDAPECVGGAMRSSVSGVSVVSKLQMDAGRLPLFCVSAIIVAGGFIGLVVALGASSTVLGIAAIVLSSLIILVATVVISLHHQNENELSFRVPLVPFLPIASVLINILMMTHLSALTWIRFVIWMAIGMTIYFFYGIRHSKEGSAVAPAPLAAPVKAVEKC